MNTKSTKKTKADRFTAMVKKIGELPATLLASADPLPASDTAMSSARRLVGGLPGASQSERVDRLARKLDVLRALDRAQPPEVMQEEPTAEAPGRCAG